MVSYGPDTQSLNYTHMYSFVDYDTSKPETYCPTKGSILDYIKRNPKCTRFLFLLNRAAMYEQLDNIAADFTVFVPHDDFLNHIPDVYFKDMDSGMARQIVKSCLLDRKINRDILTSSPVAYYYTKNPKMRMYVTNISGVTSLNGCATVIKFDIPATNGLIHMIKGFIAPNEDHFMN